jgi:hypothetical protein
VLLQVDDKPFKVEVSFLLICVDMVRPVLGKSIELSCVVEYTLIPLLKVQEFLQLGAEQTRRKVMCVERSTELIPWDMVISR